MSFDGFLPKPNALHLHLPSSLDDRHDNSLPHIHLSSIHRAKTVNKIPAFSETVPCLSKNLPSRECSSHSHLKQSFSSTDAKLLSRSEDQPVATQFCLCQPYAKISRPRNGEWQTDSSRLNMADNYSFHFISPALTSSSSNPAPRSSKSRYL